MGRKLKKDQTTIEKMTLILNKYTFKTYEWNKYLGFTTYYGIDIMQHYNVLNETTPRHILYYIVRYDICIHIF